MFHYFTALSIVGKCEELLEKLFGECGDRHASGGMGRG